MENKIYLKLIVSALLFMCAYFSNSAYAAQINLTETRIDSQRTFVTRTAGNRNNEVIIFLHGFPETSAVWEKMMSKFADQGYYTIAFDQRGYSPKARTRRDSYYSVNNLSQDVIDVADKLIGKGRNFHLVGHDWGALLGWMVANRFESRVMTYSALAIPHPKAALDFRASRDGLGFKLYTTIFKYFPRRATVPMARLIANSTAGSYESNGDKKAADNIKSVIKNGGINRSWATAAYGGLAWYRQAGLKVSDYNNRDQYAMAKTNVPSLYVFTEGDIFGKEYLIDRTRDLVSADFQAISVNAGHWPHLGAFDETYLAIKRRITSR